jgi:hypothetical protein
MKTSDLIVALSAGAGPAPRAVVARRLLPSALLALALAAAAALVGMGPAPAQMLGGVALWTKLAYAASLALSAGWLAARLARPAASTRAPRRLVLAIVAAMAVLGAASLIAAPSGERLVHLLGDSALQCPWNVLALSLPGLAASLWALRGLAPTRPRAAGLAAGLLAGAIGAMAYALACHEASITFVALWYSLGIALSGALGAVLGPRLLRW